MEREPIVVIHDPEVKQVAVPTRVLATADWLADRGCVVVVHVNDDSQLWTIDFAFEGVRQPALKFDGQSIIWSSGSNKDLLFKFLAQGLKK